MLKRITTLKKNLTKQNVQTYVTKNPSNLKIFVDTEKNSKI